MFTAGERTSRAPGERRANALAPRLRQSLLPLVTGRDADFTIDGAVSRHDILILSPDPLAAALLGAAVELAGHAPHFSRHAERPRAALRRVRPRIALIDCDDDEACSDSFIGPALMTGATVHLFRSRHTRRDGTEVAERLGLKVMVLPLDHDALVTLLLEHLGSST